MNAHYECVRCGFSWDQKPAQVTCRKCGSLYVKWVNYQEWRNYQDNLEQSKNKEGENYNVTER